MPTAFINGVNLYYETTGHGFPLVWSHEFGGTYESWAPQVSFFSRNYQVVTYNARGYPPSDVPSDPHSYSQEQSVEDLYELLQYLGIQQAYVGGFSMGGSIALNLAITHPEITKAIIIAGVGTGSSDPVRMANETNTVANRIKNEGISSWANAYATGPTRVQLRRKNPRGWEVFKRALLCHSPLGSALTICGVQGKRPTIYMLEQALQKLEVPTLILVGDEDDPCIEPAVFLKRHIRRSGLVMLPQTGHTINLEEPELFNRVVSDFLIAVKSCLWNAREPDSGEGFMAENTTTTQTG
jgi:pimeloyl-ACP methyl ester carboxylesterase